jgi:hypothetical protein
MADPVRDLNNFLQGQPGGSATKDFKWHSKREGPEHDTVYHVTAICKRTLRSLGYIFYLCTTVRGVNIGVGHGPSMGLAKRNASVQALEYLSQHGKGCDTTTTAIRI